MSTTMTPSWTIWGLNSQRWSLKTCRNPCQLTVSVMELLCVSTKLYRISKVFFSAKKTLEEHKKAFYYFIKTQSHQSHFKVDKVHLRVKLGLLSNLPSPQKMGGWMLRNNSYSESKTQDSKEIMTSIKNSPQPVPLVFYPITCELCGPHLHSSLCRASDLYRCMPARPHLSSEPLETQSPHFQVETHFLAPQAAFF